MAITVRTMKYSAQWSNAVLQCSVCFDMALLNGNVSSGLYVAAVQWL
jgi:hypothetical protein